MRVVNEQNKSRYDNQSPADTEKPGGNLRNECDDRYTQGTSLAILKGAMGESLTLRGISVSHARY